MTVDVAWKELLQATQKGQPPVAYFCGAGLSRPLIPTWKNLLTDLVELAAGLRGFSYPPDELKADIDANRHFLEIAQACRDHLTEERYRSFLEEKIHISIDKTSIPHSWLSLFDLQPKLVVTTNWDRIPDIACDGTYPTYTNRETTEASRDITNGKPVILKIHGDITNQESIVFTQKDYSDLISSNVRLRDLLLQVMRSFQTIFLGFSFDDPHLDIVLNYLHSVMDNMPLGHFAILSNATDFQREMLEKKYGLRIVTYTPSNQSHPELTDMLAKIRNGVSSIQSQLKPDRGLMDELHDALMLSGFVSFYVGVVGGNHLHISIESRAGSELELQREILSILRGLKGTSSALTMFSIFLHERTKPTHEHARFGPVLLICKGSFQMARQFAEGNLTTRDLWTTLRFYRLVDPAPMITNMKQVSFRFIEVL